MTSNEIVLSMAPDAIKARMNYAQVLAGSGLIPSHFQRQPANVLVAIETGAALGIPPIQALQGIAVINGKATMSADLMAAVVRRAGHTLRVREEGDRVTAILIRRDDPDFMFTVTWTPQKATEAGLWGRKGPWTQYPMQMLRSRAITEVCRQGASDALFGLIYAPEELGADVDEDGNVVSVDRSQPPHNTDHPQVEHTPVSTPQAPAQDGEDQDRQRLVESIYKVVEYLQLKPDAVKALVRRVSGKTAFVRDLPSQDLEKVLDELKAIANSFPSPEENEDVVDAEIVEDEQP
ncbi:hypothetical protein G7Y41_08880 [Schaalia sp. ZJ405]|uniref:hypothetical protein n=1 Tax=Schaalia sp. ZJ405 TaxID=2709403 RepID=UPI0018CB88C4|nr:hypothetical protein [Schaalia sp. ZJ405]QPK81139.1 hypothetical protein G7Y41_08880 [Schaalia sp. ZJ405]